MQLLTADGRNLERRTTPPGSLWPASPWDISPPTNGQMGSGVGGAVSERTARGLSAFYSCLSVLYDGLATLPIRQFQGVGAARVEVDPSPVIYDPWPEVTDLDFRGQGTWGLAARGNFIARVTDRDKRRYPTQLQPLDNDRVDVRRNTKSGALEYWVQSETEPIPIDDVFHIRNIVRPGSVMGLNPIAELRLTWALAAGADSYAATFFSNASLPNGVITIPDDLSEEQGLALRDQWQQMHQGINKANLPAVLTGGAEWHQLAVNLEDAQFIESRQLSRSEVAGVFRIPPHMIGDLSRATFSNIEHQSIEHVTDTIRPWCIRLESEFKRKSFTARERQQGYYVEFALDALLRGDSLTRALVQNRKISMAQLTPNEARRQDNMPATSSDTFFIQSGFIPVDEAHFRDRKGDPITPVPVDPEEPPDPSLEPSSFMHATDAELLLPLLVAIDSSAEAKKVINRYFRGVTDGMAAADGRTQLIALLSGDDWKSALIERLDEWEASS